MFMAMDEYGIDFQDKIASFSAIAPIAFMINATSPLANFARSTLASSLCYTNVWAVVGQKYTGFLGNKIVEMFTNSLVTSSREVGGSKTLLAKVVGFFPERYHPDKIQGYIKHINSGTSIKDLFHFGQIIQGGAAKISRNTRINAQNDLKYPKMTENEFFDLKFDFSAFQI